MERRHVVDDSNPIVLQRDGAVKLIVSACLYTSSNKEKGMFIRCDDLFLLNFREPGRAAFFVENVTSNPIHFIMKDPEGKRINAIDYVPPFQKITIDCHDSEERELRVSKVERIGTGRNVNWKFCTFTVFNEMGDWKILDSYERDFLLDVDQPDGCRSDVSMDGLSKGYTARLSLGERRSQKTVGINDPSIDYSLRCEFRFAIVILDRVLPVSTTTNHSVVCDKLIDDDKCCICLDDIRGGYRFARCGHRCVCSSTTCFDVENPPFLNCPLCRSVIKMAIVVPY